jgi:putative hydrolase of the HAD superfamily
MASIDAVIFDIGNVLVKHDNGLLFQRLAKQCRLPHASSQTICDAIVDSGLRTGEQSVPAFYAELVRNFAFQGDYDAFVQLWVRGIDPIPETLTLLPRLHGVYRLFILSDTNEEHWQHVAKNYLDPALFENIFLSHRLGMVKPDLRLFEYVLETIGCPPAHCVFIDDTQKNVEAARTLGINSYVFTSTFDLSAELAKLREFA